MKAYYAHCESTYGTPQEDHDVDMMGRVGINVMNPNSPEYQEQIQMLKDYGRESEIPGFLLSLVDKCDSVIFRALPDGSISADVHQQILHAQDSNKTVLEMPTLEGRKVLTEQETRDYIEQAKDTPPA
jgi:hypothetical protein